MTGPAIPVLQPATSLGSPTTSLGRKRPVAQSGSVLVITIVLSLVIMIALDGLMILLTTEYRMVTRTAAYGSALYVAEAGVEEGVAMLNYGNSNWSANGWSSSGSSYVKTVNNFSSLNNGSSIGSYSVVLSSITSTNPTVVCTGIVSAVGTTVSGASNTNVSRTVEVILSPRAMFQWGLLAQNQIDLQGNNITVDSFDSSNPSYSSWTTNGFGTYTSSKDKDNGDVASNAGVTNTISVGNAGIYGHVATGLGGTATVGPNGFVAALGQATNGVIDSNRVSHSMDVALTPPTLPTSFSPIWSWSSINDGTVLYGGSSSPVDYRVNSINLSSSDQLVIHSGYVRLYVTGNTSITGNAGIVVYPGAKLEIYSGGSASIGGNGVANNDGRAYNFQFYELNSSSVSIAGNGQLTGVVYAPQSNLTISGGGSSGSAVGSFVGNNITMNGHVDFHYDEALKNHGPTRGYSVVAWQEL